MKLFIAHIISFFFCGLLFAQHETGYYKLNADSVIYQFDIRAYEELAKDPSSIFNDFDSLDFREVINNKQISAWESEGWELVQVNDHEYQLRKCFGDFEAFDWKDRHLVPSESWKFPRSEPLESIGSSAKSTNKQFAIVSENGNTTFKLKGYKKATKVILAGSFNRWNEDEIKMKLKDGYWQVKMDLSPGIYEYKFIIDGEWTHDLSNPLSVQNEHFTLNSILLVGSDYTFYLDGHKKAKNVVLASSFNNWDESVMSMEKTSSGWKLTVPVPPGKHFYKFKIEKDWVLDPVNELQQKDGEGNINSVILVN